MQCACVILSSVICPAYNIFPQFLSNDTILGKTLSNGKCVLFPSVIVSETFLILRRNKRDKIKNLCWPSSKLMADLFRF